MTRHPAAPPFAPSFVFPDVEPEILAGEERESRAETNAWVFRGIPGGHSDAIQPVIATECP
jgi:hypothetical protein